MTIGLDIGGANIKIAFSDSYFSKYLPLWKNKAAIYEELLRIKEGARKEVVRGGGMEVAAVMTGELCDCFKTKKEGVLYIGSAIHDIFGDKAFFLDTEGAFKDFDCVIKSPYSFASTNWLASAKFLAKTYKNAIFVDIGSTTTDIIPIVGGRIKAGKTDLERLKRGELLYSGILRTNISSLLKKVRIGDEEYNLSSELFAITADAYLVLSYITKEEYTCESPNSYAFKGEEGEEKSKISAMRRLSRLVCSDLEEIGEEAAISIAEQVKEAQVKELTASLRLMKEKYGLKEVISAGIGDFIVEEAVELLGMSFLPLSSIYDKQISAVFPAYSVAKLLEEEGVR
ncbi:MAG: hydantoinase/oxoprolinase family protein [Candidatus Methanospirareceae archaeon]